MLFLLLLLGGEIGEIDCILWAFTPTVIVLPLKEWRTLVIIIVTTISFGWRVEDGIIFIVTPTPTCGRTVAAPSYYGGRKLLIAIGIFYIIIIISSSILLIGIIDGDTINIISILRILDLSMRFVVELELTMRFVVVELLSWN